MISEKQKEYTKKYKATEKYRQQHKKYQKEYNMRYTNLIVSIETAKKVKELGQPHNKSNREVMEIILYFLDKNGFDMGPLILEQELNALKKRQAEIVNILKQKDTSNV